MAYFSDFIRYSLLSDIMKYSTEVSPGGSLYLSVFLLQSNWLLTMRVRTQAGRHIHDVIL